MKRAQLRCIPIFTNTEFTHLDDRDRANAYGDDRERDWGHGGWGRRGAGRGRGRGRMRRGDIRTAILAVLVDGPGHGYDIMSRLEEKSGGVWRPSAGSVYPTLQQLEDEGLVDVGRRRRQAGLHAHRRRRAPRPRGASPKPAGSHGTWPAVASTPASCSARSTA